MLYTNIGAVSNSFELWGSLCKAAFIWLFLTRDWTERVRVLFFPFGGWDGERGDVRGEALIYQIYPMESEIGGDLEPHPTLLALTSCIFHLHGELLARRHPWFFSARGFHVNPFVYLWYGIILPYLLVGCYLACYWCHLFKFMVYG